MKHLGIDVGSERVGVAVSDDSGAVAFPLKELERKTCVSRLSDLIKEKKITTVVFGESVNLDGTDNPIMKEVREIADALQKQVKIVFEPEQFSTQAAGRLGKGSDVEAATIILQSYLDRRRAGKEEIIDFD